MLQTEVYAESIEIKSETSALIPDTLQEIPLEEVAEHDHYNDCWIVLYDRVYNVTSFLANHPGGEDVILDYAGRDATFAFRGTGHSKNAVRMLNKYIIGELPSKQRIFRVDNGTTAVLRSGIPD